MVEVEQKNNQQVDPDITLLKVQFALYSKNLCGPLLEIKLSLLQNKGS